MQIHQQVFDYIEPIRRPQDDGLAGKSIDEKFEAFHAANPGVYLAIVRIALDLRGRGYRQYGMKGIFEHLRWTYRKQQLELNRGCNEKYKLNNNYTSYYARMIMNREPALVGFFELREQRQGE